MSTIRLQNVGRIGWENLSQKPFSWQQKHDFPVQSLPPIHCNLVCQEAKDPGHSTVSTILRLKPCHLTGFKLFILKVLTPTWQCSPTTELNTCAINFKSIELDCNAGIIYDFQVGCFLGCKSPGKYLDT